MKNIIPDEYFMKNIISVQYNTACPKKYPLLTVNRNETIKYYYSPSRQLNLSIFTLDSNTLDLNIVHQTLEIKARKVQIYSAPETRGFEKRLIHDLYHGYFPKHH